MNGRRPLALGAAGLLHVALVALLLSGNGRAVPATTPGAITVRAVPAPPRPAVAAPDLPPIAVDLAPPAVEIAALPAGDDCPILGAIAAALVKDPEVATALTAETATALMLWDGSWSPDPALLPVRRVVLDRIRATNSACRDADMTGPRLIIVPNGTGTLAIAVGSGTWNWRQLLS